MDGKLLLLDEDVPHETGEYQNGWFIHACKLCRSYFVCHFLYMYISCGCLTLCLNSKRSSSTRGNTTEDFSRCPRCLQLYLFRSGGLFFWQPGKGAQTSSRGTKWHLELRKLTGVLKKSSCCYYCCCWVRTLGWPLGQSKLHPGHLIHFANSHIFAVMNFQVHFILHKAYSCACACEYPLFMKGRCCIGRVNRIYCSGLCV